jgi:mono/diheme cytochrome c family protein
MNRTIAAIGLAGVLILFAKSAAQNPRPEIPKRQDFYPFNELAQNGARRDHVACDEGARTALCAVEGHALYDTYCAVCHGDDAKGRGPMARVLKTPPPDLTHIWMRQGGRFSLERVERIISGETEVGAHGTSEMPSWGPIFSQGVWDQDAGKVRIHNLARYLEQIQAN